MRLTDYAADVQTQFGEDGMIAEIFRRIGVSPAPRCVEFGAADGKSCSNTARLREQGWSALLIEADLHLFKQLRKEEAALVRCVHATVTPTNINTLIADWSPEQIDFVSIDVDGDDYQIWEAMTGRQRVVCIEYNQSVPPHAVLRQADLGDTFGQSARALVDLATTKGYELVGLTPGNLLFVVAEEADRFADLERDLTALFDYDALTYIVTDYRGRTACVGQPPWGVAGPYLGATIGVPIQPIEQAGGPADPFLGLTLDQLRSAYETLYGRAVYIDPSWHNVAAPHGPAPERLDDLLRLNPPIVLVDISMVADDTQLEWILSAAESRGYSHRKTGRLIALINKEHHA